MDIQKMIEEEAERNAQFEDVFAYIGYLQSYLRSVEIDQFKAGASFALSQLQHANRWRKVSEELPELKINEFIDVLVKNEDGDVGLFSIITTADIDTIKNHYLEWKPIE